VSQNIAATRTALPERNRELASLDSSIHDAAMGTGHVALVEGRAGIGKTQLLAEARRRAAEGGLRTLGARGGELEREFAFGVVRQLFEPLVVQAEARNRLLAGAAAAARPIFEPLQSADEDLGDTSFAVLHGLFWLTVNLSSESPHLLAIDDLHWCDRASLRFLAYLVRRLEGLPVLVVCSLRQSEPDADLALLAEIAGDHLTGVQVSRERGTTILSVNDVVSLGVEKAAERALEVAWDGAEAVWLSFDIDSVDCGFVPGTGWPEPGGFLPREVLEFLRLVAASGVCGMEVVEVSPPYDVADTTALLAVRAVMDVLGSLVAAGKLPKSGV